MHGTRVLIVEDDYLVAAGLAHVITKLGVIVVGPVCSVYEALKIIGEQTLDGSLLDVRLSDGNCGPVADALTERHIPFVVVTAYERSTLPNGLKLAPYVGKPTLTDELLEVAQKTFGLPSASGSEPPPICSSG